MNTEEIKLVLETISKVSQDASLAAVVWLVLHYVSQMLVPVCWVVATVLVTRQGARLVVTMSGRESDVQKHKLDLEANKEVAVKTVMRLYKAWSKHGDIASLSNPFLSKNEFYSVGHTVFDKLVEMGEATPKEEKL